MKIGFDAKRAFHNTTGLGNYSRDLISILAKRNTECDFYLYNTKQKRVDRLKKYNHVIEKLPKSWFYKKVPAIWRQKGVVKQLKEDKIDVYHGLSGEIPKALSKNNIKSVVTIHDLIFMRYPNLYSFFDRKIHFYKFKYAAENADKVIAISEQTKKDIVRFLKVDPSKIEVIYQGCHGVFKEESSEEEKNELKSKYKLPDKFLLNVGTIEYRKNILSVIKAIKELPTTLVIVGKKTKYFEEIEVYIQKHKIENKVVFLEGMTLKELSVLYQSAQIFVYPSVFEGFGIPIIEALYSKVPVITTQGGVFPEAGGPNSIYVEENDIALLQLEIEKLLNNDALRNKIIEQGYKFVQKFNDDIIERNIMSVYKKLMDE